MGKSEAKHYLYEDSSHKIAFKVVGNSSLVLKVQIWGKSKKGRSKVDALPHIHLISRTSFEMRYNLANDGEHSRFLEINNIEFIQHFNSVVERLKKTFC